MTKDILVQYTDLKEEIEDLQRRIQNTRSRIEKIESGGTVIDSVKGSRRDGTIGSIRIEGFPLSDYNNKEQKLFAYMTQLENAKEKLIGITNEAEEYINSITDSRMRRIIRYKCIDGLSWYGVADKMGGRATSESVRKAFERFLEKS